MNKYSYLHTASLSTIMQTPSFSQGLSGQATGASVSGSSVRVTGGVVMGVLVAVGLSVGLVVTVGLVVMGSVVVVVTVEVDLTVEVSAVMVGDTLG